MKNVVKNQKKSSKKVVFIVSMVFSAFLFLGMAVGSALHEFLFVSFGSLLVFAGLFLIPVAVAMFLAMRGKLL